MSEELSLSEELRRAREGRGETLDQVNKRTGISLKVLEALEEGDMEALEVVYLRLAVVHYGDYLGLDGHALAQAFEGRRSSARVVRRRPRGGGTVLAGGLVKPVAAIAIAGLLAVLYLVNDGQGDADPPVAPTTAEVAAAPSPPAASEPPDAPQLSSTPEAAGDPESAEVSEASGAPASGPGDEAAAMPGAVAGGEGGEPAPSEGAVAAASAAAAPMVLQAEVLDTVWVQIDSDGVGSAMETIPGGEQRTWRAERFFQVHVGRSQNIRFRLQGRPLAEGRLGEPGGTLRFRVSADGYQLLDSEFQPIGEVVELQSERTESRQPGVR